MCIRDRVTDDPDRENEGDLICAAEFATRENINFMATYAKGLICTPVSYTHLDVYKRQEGGNVMNKNHCKQENIRLGTHGEDYGSWMSNPVFYIIGGIGVLTAVLAVLSFYVLHVAVLGVLFTAVSYTHLDVYKRQWTG